jgi:FkbM family methyltransferase
MAMSGNDMVRMLFAEQACMINVLDVGAIRIEGMKSPYDDLIESGYARVVGFEPDAKGCEELNRKHGAPHLFLPYFVGDGKHATFYETNWALTGSLFKPHKEMLEMFQNLHEVVTLKAEHKVETKRLDDLPEVGDIDFVKIDVQGAELAVFQGGERVLRNAVLVYTEVEFVELYENQPLFADVDCLMRSYGYQFHAFDDLAGRCFKPLVVNNNINQRLRQVLWADAIYVKDWLRFDGLPLDKLKKLAVLLHEVVHSYDLCHLALQAIDVRSNRDFAQRYLQSFASPSGS